VSELRRTQEERRTEAEQRLLAAAAELIAEVGPSGITLANVGERAGYSRGLATHHFGSKGAMMQRLVDSVTYGFREQVFVESASDTVLDQALGLVRAYFHELAQARPANRARLVLWADAVATGSPDVRPAMLAADREFREAITKTLQRGVSGGEFPASVDPPGLATVIIAMLRGVALQAVLDDQVDLEACRKEIERLLKDRLQREAKRESG
jgi:AcrR family transcriptional regulator